MFDTPRRSDGCISIPLRLHPHSSQESVLWSRNKIPSSHCRINCSLPRNKSRRISVPGLDWQLQELAQDLLPPHRSIKIHSGRSEDGHGRPKWLRALEHHKYMFVLLLERDISSNPHSWRSWSAQFWGSKSRSIAIWIAITDPFPVCHLLLFSLLLVLTEEWAFGWRWKCLHHRSHRIDLSPGSIQSAIKQDL